jgi:aldehyde:ferredoxin oxidoreductase
MMRAFNFASGFTKEDDALPPRMFKPLAGGDTAGKVVDEAKYKEALEMAYEMMGWDKDGKPKRSRLSELDLDGSMKNSVSRIKDP